MFFNQIFAIIHLPTVSTFELGGDGGFLARGGGGLWQNGGGGLGGTWKLDLVVTCEKSKICVCNAHVI